MKKTIVLFALLCLSSWSFAQKMYTPKVGTPERKAFMDLVRTPAEKDMGQKLKFVVSTLNVRGNEAVMFGSMQQENGKDVDIKKIKNKDLILGEGSDAFFENNIQALYKKQGTKWVLVTYMIGCTDLCWAGWPEEFGVSKEVLGMK